MHDLTSPRLMYLKAILFLVVGATACAIILLDHPSWKIAALLALAIWAFARAYYFAFYVIQHYIDPAYRFAGLGSVLSYVLRKQRGQTALPPALPENPLFPPEL
jgi:hypothetical protein